MAEFITFSQAAKLIPSPHLLKKHVTPTTVLRFVRDGRRIGGRVIKLKTRVNNFRFVTTLEDVERFNEECRRVLAELISAQVESISAHEE